MKLGTLLEEIVLATGTHYVFHYFQHYFAPKSLITEIREKKGVREEGSFQVVYQHQLLHMNQCRSLFNV